MQSLWIEHVKMIQAKNWISYKDAMKAASETYKTMHPVKSGEVFQLWEERTKTTSTAATTTSQTSKIKKFF